MEKKTLSEYFQLIDKFIDNNHFEPAYHHAAYLLTQFPKSVALYQQLGRILLELKRFDDAADIYLRRAAILPDDWLNFFTLGIIFIGNDRPETAARYAAYAFALEPKIPDVRALNRRLKSYLSAAFIEELKIFNAGRSKLPDAGTRKREKTFAPIRDSGLKLLADYFRSRRESDRFDDLQSANENVLRKLPYCKKTLRTLLDTYAKYNDLTRFQRCADRLSELDPELVYLPGENGTFIIEEKTVRVSYFEWTGFPNIRGRSIWQQAQSRYLAIEPDRVAACLDLVEVPVDFVVRPSQPPALPEPENRRLFQQDSWKSLGSTSVEDDLFFQQDYFETQSTRLSTPEAVRRRDGQTQNATSAPSEANPGKILEDAYDFLEKVVTEGFTSEELNPIESIFGDAAFAEARNKHSKETGSPTAQGAAEEIRAEPSPCEPPGTPDTVKNSGGTEDQTPRKTDTEAICEIEAVAKSEPESAAKDQTDGPNSAVGGKPERTPDGASEATEDGRNPARDAWNAFVQGRREEAIEKYRALIESGTETDKIRADLRTLSIIFPEIDALSELAGRLEAPL